MDSGNKFKDQLGREIIINSSPNRIVSIVPSQTELLYSLGLEDRVVGITKFCVHPESWFHGPNKKERVGGTKNLNLEKIRSLAPDLIIANKEENSFEQIHELAKDIPVWISDVRNLEQALDMIRVVGKLVGKDQEANDLVVAIQKGFQKLAPVENVWKGIYLIWRAPWMAAGKDTFINDILTRTGIENLAVVLPGRYPEISLSEFEKPKPELILLSSEPYPFNEKYREDLQRQFREATVELVDGEMFSWYGSRLLQAASYLADFQDKITAFRKGNKKRP